MPRKKIVEPATEESIQPATGHLRPLLLTFSLTTVTPRSLTPLPSLSLRLHRKPNRPPLALRWANRPNANTTTNSHE